MCESWRPGVADRLGVGYDAVVAVNPSVVYCSLSGFGQDGPLRDVPGHDLNFQAIAGAVAPRAGEEPQVPRLPVADLEGGTVCAVLITAAWARKQATGVGERIDVAMADVVAWWVGPRSGTALEGSESRTAGSPGYGVFRTADDRWVALGVLGEARLWDGICRGLGLDDLVGLSFADRLARQAEVDGAIAAAIARLDRDDAVARLQAEGAPVTPVLSPEEATAHPHLASPRLPRRQRRRRRRRPPGPLRRRDRERRERCRSPDPRPRPRRAPRRLHPPLTHRVLRVRCTSAYDATFATNAGRGRPQMVTVIGAWETFLCACSRTWRTSPSFGSDVPSGLASVKPV